jgi:hypothetical protein
MKPQFGQMIPIVFVIAGFTFAQQPVSPSEPAPIFRVTVVERSTKAINYHLNYARTECRAPDLMRCD